VSSTTPFFETDDEIKSKDEEMEQIDDCSITSHSGKVSAATFVLQRDSSPREGKHASVIETMNGDGNNGSVLVGRLLREHFCFIC